MTTKIIAMNLNLDLFYFINNGLANPTLDAIMPQLTNIGGFVVLLAICILAVIVLKYLKKDRYLKIAKLCLMALILSGIVAAALKLLIHEPRPYVVLDHVRQLVMPSEPNSFPSGHTSSTFSVVTVLAHELWNYKLLVIVLVAFCILIAFSRIYCGMHYPSDVAVGAIVGIIGAAVALKVKL